MATQIPITMKYPTCHHILNKQLLLKEINKPWNLPRVAVFAQTHLLKNKRNKTLGHHFSKFGRDVYRIYRSSISCLLKIASIVRLWTTEAERMRSTALFSPAAEISGDGEKGEKQKHNDEHKRCSFYSHVLFFLFWYFVTMSCKLPGGCRRRETQKKERVRDKNNTVHAANKDLHHYCKWT